MTAHVPGARKIDRQVSPPWRRYPPRMKRLRTVVQVNVFALRTLQARSWWGLGISAALLGLGVWLGLRDYSAGAWLSLIAGTAGLGREMWSLLQAIRAPSSVVLNRDADFAKELVARVRASDEELRDGFDVVPLPHGRGEAIVRSPAVDSWLRANPVGMEECQTKRDDVDRQLRTHAGMLETVLRCHARKSLRSVPPRALFNEEKLGLSDGISPRRPNVRVHRVGYFHSLLTNEAAAKSLEALGEDPKVVFSGADHLYPVDRANGQAWSLLPLAQSGMSDHIGVSTLVVTRDRKLVFWNQGSNAQQSRNRYVSTGSGSCDWHDRVDADLKATLTAAMEREFREESFGDGVPPPFEHSTRVIGYFRWLSRGAKPEFTGATRIGLDAHRLRPNTAEVNRRGRSRLCRDVPTLECLVRVLGELLETEMASVSLWANALALREAVAEAPADWSAFLGLPLEDRDVGPAAPDDLAMANSSDR